MKFSEVLGNVDLDYFQHRASGSLDKESYVGDPAFRLPWTFRRPERNYNLATHDFGGTKVTEWHTDGPFNRAVIVWSDTYPTEILYPSGRIVTAEPGDVVLFDNRHVRHRVPKAYIQDVQRGVASPRHFARIQMAREPSQADIDKWKEHFACLTTPAM